MPEHAITYTAQNMFSALQAESQTPIWLPVSLTSSSETATVVSGNSSEGLIESRWLEIFPVWEEQHRVSVDSEQLCPEKAGDDVDNTCGRPVASAPVIIDNGTTPWLMKGEPGVFLSSIADDGAGKVCINAATQVLRIWNFTVLTHHVYYCTSMLARIAMRLFNTV